MEEHMSNYINHMSARDSTHSVTNSPESQNEANVTIGSESEVIEKSEPASSMNTSRKKKPRNKKEQGLRREIDDLDTEI